MSKLVRLLKKWHVATREPILFFIICIRSILEYGSQVFSSCSTKLSKRRRTKTIQRRYMLSTFISERTCKINTLCNFHLVECLAIRCHSNVSYTEEAVLVCKLRISRSYERRCYVKKNSTRVRIGRGCY